MDNSKPSTSNEGTSEIKEKTKVCKSCSKNFDESRILKHITHGSCEDNYTKEELEMLRKLADERRIRKSIENRHKNRKKKLESDLLVATEVCTSCQKTFSETSILKHITHSESCMKNYSEEEMGFLRFLADKRKKDREVDYWTENDKRKLLKNAEYWEKNKESIVKQRKEKSEKDKQSKEGLLKKCKSCQKQMGEKSILKHISQKESCMKDYSENDMEYLRNWADKRNKARKSNYYERNKSSILPEKSLRYKEEKEKKKEELRKKGIERDKETFESSKKFKEKQARSHNSVDYSVAKNNFPQAFAEFKTFSLSDEDFQLVSSFENSIEEMYKKFENEINRFANLAKELKYERNVSWPILEDMYRPIEPSLIVKEWHELEFKINLSLKDIATKMKRPYVWTGGCKCKKCQNAKNVKGKGKGKGKKSKN